MRLHELKETRAAKVAEMTRLQADADAAGRDLSDNEAPRFDALGDEVRAIETKIQRAETLAEMERRSNAEPVGGPDMARELRSYSLGDAILGALSGRLTGLEAEVHRELSRGRQTRSGNGIHLAVPTEILIGEARNQTVGTGSAGGHLVATQLGTMADRFRPALLVESMGATVLRGLTGNLDLPNLTASGTAHWVAENGAPTRSAATFEKIGMDPKTVAGEYRMSRRLMLQSGTAIEGILRRDLGFLLAQALDAAAIKGDSTTNSPTGILNTLAVQQVATTAPLGVVDYFHTSADLVSALELDDVTGSRALLTHPKVPGNARKRRDAESRGITLAEQFHGERLETTTQVPTNLGAGNDKTAIICGLWSELVIGYWSAVDILVNPYHSDVASNGGALLHAFLDADVAVRHTEAFAFAEV